MYFSKKGWMSKFDVGHYFLTESNNEKRIYSNILRQLQNSANIIGNKSDCSREIKVLWSDGSNVNDISNDNIYISPDKLISGGKVNDELLEAMTGKVYVASYLRETVDIEAYNDSMFDVVNMSDYMHPEDNIVSNGIFLWRTLEIVNARELIAENWAGFIPYVNKEKVYNSIKKNTVKKFVNSEEISLDAAICYISWNYQNSDDLINHEIYNKCLELFYNELERDSSENNYKFCVNVVRKVWEMLQQECGEDGSESSPEDQDGSESSDSQDGSDSSPEAQEGSDLGEGSQDSIGEGKEEKEAQEGSQKPKLQEPAGEYSGPKTFDSSLLGEKVKSSVEEDLSESYVDDVSAPSKLNDVGRNYKLVDLTVDEYKIQEYNKIVNDHRSEIRSIVNSLSFRNNTQSNFSYGNRSGDIDENNLYKIKMNDDRIMTRRDVVGSKKIAICLLVDESGSMSGQRIINARNVSIVLAESMKSVEGIDLSIYGHTAEEYNISGGEGVCLREYVSPRKPHIHNCMCMEARLENHDGYAILHTSKLFLQDYADYDRKIMFVISDGEPAGSKYHGRLAMEHVRDCTNNSRSKNLEVYGIGVCDAFSSEKGELMYGADNFVVLSNVTDSLGVISRFIRQVASK